MNNKIVILGAGESGVGAAILAKRKGNEVFVSDSGIIKKYIKTFFYIMKLPLKKRNMMKALFWMQMRSLRVQVFPTMLL
jgi:thioredoxin reductase